MENRRSESGGGVSPSGSRLSRAGARAISLGVVGVELGGRLRYTFVSADPFNIWEAVLSTVAPGAEVEDARAISEGVWCLKVWPADRLASWLVESLKFPSAPTVHVSPSSQTISSDRQRSHSP